jgi:hypothetical protein
MGTTARAVCKLLYRTIALGWKATAQLACLIVLITACAALLLVVR